MSGIGDIPDGRRSRGPLEAIVIGASAGGVNALLEILPALPAELPAAVLVVLHLPPDRPSLLGEIFGRVCALPVHDAEDKQPLEPGMLLFAPPDYHLLVDRGPPHIVLSVDPPEGYSRPSIDALFETAADVFGPRLTGIVLTGASDDGAAGLEAIVRAGGTAIVQDPDEAEVPTMPVAALARAPSARVMTLAAIAAHLRATAGSSRR